MHYQISRNGQTYGPYTLEDLKRYLASGNVLPTDMAKSDEMPDWVPVSELLGTMPVPPAPAPVAEPAAAFTGQSYADPAYTGPVYTDPAQAGPLNPNAAFVASQYPDAPNLNWGLYLLFAVLTCTLFSKVFTVIQAVWLKRVQPNSNALIFYIALYAVEIVSMFFGFGMGMNMAMHPGRMPLVGTGVAGILRIVSLILLIVARFVTSASLEEHFNGPEPVGLRLNPVMVFFFGGVYFQYHLNRINALKQAARYGVGRTF